MLPVTPGGDPFKETDTTSGYLMHASNVKKRVIEDIFFNVPDEYTVTII